MYRIQRDTGRERNLIIELDGRTKINSYIKGVLTHSRINGIINISYQRGDDQERLVYHTEGYDKLLDVYNGSISRKEVFQIFTDICMCVKELTHYGITEESLLLREDMLFYDRSSGHIQVVVLPFQQDEEVMLIDFFRKLLFWLPTGRNDSYILVIKDYFQQNPNLTVDQIMEYLGGNAEAKDIRQREDVRGINAEPQKHVQDSENVNRKQDIEKEKEKPVGKQKTENAASGKVKKPLVEDPFEDFIPKDKKTSRGKQEDKEKKEIREKGSKGSLFAFTGGEKGR